MGEIGYDSAIKNTRNRSTIFILASILLNATLKGYLHPPNPSSQHRGTDIDEIVQHDIKTTVVCKWTSCGNIYTLHEALAWECLTINSTALYYNELHVILLLDKTVICYLNHIKRTIDSFMLVLCGRKNLFRILSNAISLLMSDLDNNVSYGLGDQ